MSERPAGDHAAIYLVGAGIASLAATAFLIRDGDVLAEGEPVARNGLERPKVTAVVDVEIRLSVGWRVPC